MQYGIQRYMNVGSTYNVSVLDNETVAFISDITGVPQAYLSKIDPDGKILWPQQLTFGANRVLEILANPRPDDRRLIFTRDEGGNENIQFILLDPDTGEETLLTEGHTDAMHLLGKWSADGSAFAFAANRRDKRLFDLYTQSIDGEAKLVWENQTAGYLFNAKISPDGQRVLAMHVISNANAPLIEVDAKAGEARVVTGATNDVQYRWPHYLADGATALVLTDKDSDFMYITRLNLNTGTLEPIVQHEWGIEAFTLAHDQSFIVYSVNVDGNFYLYKRDLTTSESVQMPPADVAGVIANLRLTPDDRKVLFSASYATRSYDVYVWDLEADTVRPITQSSHAGIPQKTFVAPDLIHYPTFDQDESGATRQIPAWVYRPQQTSDEKLPVVVIVHGGPEGQSLPNFNGLLQYFVNNGYAAVVPNVRGSVGYGKAYAHLDDVRKRMDSVADLAQVVDWIKAQDDLDGERVAVYGGSYGGFMVLSSMTTYPDLWKTGVNIVGISSFVTFLENTSDYRRAHREAEYGSLEHDREFLDSISPINHIDNIAAPLFVIHGANDPRVPLSEAEQLVAALEKRNVPVELLVFDDEGHGLAKRKNRLVAYAQVVEFLGEHL